MGIIDKIRFKYGKGYKITINDNDYFLSKDNLMGKFKKYITDVFYHARFGGRFWFDGNILTFDKNSVWKVTLDPITWKIHIMDVDYDGCSINPEYDAFVYFTVDSKGLNMHVTEKNPN